MTYKTKATGGGRQWENTKYKPEHHSDLLAGGQCDQPGGRLRPALIFLGVVFMKSSRANLFGVPLLSWESSLSILRFSSDVRACSRVYSRLDSSSTSRSLVRSIIDAIPFFFWFRSDLSIVHSCKAMRRSTSYHGAGDGYSCSLALRRWRRLISPFAAVTKKPAVLSPGSLSCSISSITSCGILTVVICDFAFFAPVAISGSPKNWCMSVYAKKMIKKGLKCISPVSKLKSKGEIHLKEQRPAVLATHAGRLTTNDSESIEVAMLNHTTHPQGRDSHNLNKYIWRFIALSTAQPRVITIEATSEQEARQQSPAGCVMVFAARIRQGVSHA
ncbi:ash family protein [Escherichia coli]|nr:ash family protein [Escherichia coli]EJM9604457.1 host cell division inhibitor Icd-like protein [Escherichia albertii]EGC2951380.1 ash family protein [Escherichia coli]EGD0494584.1 ash family protein [Escherichia coli]HAJ3828465.1 ash family protein [Escherichia coli]